jgi:Mg-chelatase subunit ChlI
LDTLKELKYYCEEDTPVGAMLLTGEWGCGKTYLIDHGLKDTLENTHIIIRSNYSEPPIRI